MFDCRQELIQTPGSGTFPFKCDIKPTRVQQHNYKLEYNDNNIGFCFTMNIIIFGKGSL